MAPFVTPPGFDPKTQSSYHYIPTGWVCATFITLFSISTLVHFIQAIHYRLWWLLPTAILAGLGEILGWSARYWSSLNDGTLATPFLIQISATIISPTPLLAAYFIIVGRLIVMLGPQYSRLRPRMYNKLFLTVDIIALVVQAAGGGIASGSQSNLGGNIMLAGIVFQFISLIAFITLSTEFLIRLRLDRPHRNWKPVEKHNGSVESLELVKGRLQDLTVRTRLLLAGIAFSITCLFIRAVYRTVELSDGWNGRIISTQVYFNVLDGMMVVLAFIALNIFHPGVALSHRQTCSPD